jgi:spore coat polysaccharide biosynthesis protein SpsF
MVKVFKRGGCDYLCNDLELTYPLGIYAHVIRVSCLVALNRRAELTEQEREDVVRYIYEHPNEHRVANITAPTEFAYPGLRLTIDYPEDLELARTIYARFGGCRFTTGDVIGLYRNEPELFKKTRGLVQRSAPFLKRAANE